MTRIQRARRAWFAALLLFFLALPVLPSGAKLLEVYDLDSLVHLSTDVVEAEIIRNDLGQVEVKVALVHKGDLKAGQNVAVAGCDFYRKLGKDILEWLPLAAGDRLVLFLARASTPGDRVTYLPQPGGMMLFVGDHLHGFSQWVNPGPYVAGLPSNDGADESPTVEQFQQRLRDSLRDTRKWVELVEAKPDHLDVERLTKLLAARSGRADGTRDHFSERICVRFAESHDLGILSRALPLTDNHGRAILQRGFGTPAGRDWLLAKVADANEPMPARILYSYALCGAGAVYRSTFTGISATSWRPEGDPDEGNSGYLTRIAKTARALGPQEALCRNLLECLDYFAQGIVQNKPVPLMADLRGAFVELAEFHRMNPSEELRFAIEKATRWDRRV